MLGDIFQWRYPEPKAAYQRRHPERPRFYQRAEGSRAHRIRPTQDPSLRLKNGCARDDAFEEATE